MSVITYGKLPPFVALPWDVLNSPAYKDLMASAAKALPFFFGKVKCSFNAPERYTPDFSFSYTEAKRHGFATSTHHRVISELIEKGFVDPVCKGGKRSFGFSSSLFKLSWRWKEYGSSDFELQKWKRTASKMEGVRAEKADLVSKIGAVEAISTLEVFPFLERFLYIASA